MKLFVGNVPTNSNPVELRQLFEEYGGVSECEIIKDYAFIHMPSESDATKARQNLMYYNFNGSRLNVRKATSPVSCKSSSYASYSILKPSPKHKKKWTQPQKKTWKIITKTTPIEAGQEDTMRDSTSFPALDENVSASEEYAVGSERHSVRKANDITKSSVDTVTDIGTSFSLPSLEKHVVNATTSSNIALGYGKHVQCSPWLTDEDILPSYSEFAKQMEAFYTRPLEAWSLENAHG